MEYPAREEIRALCTEQSFERGGTYYHQGRIQELDIDGGEIRATVRGSRDYDVAIDVTEDTIRTHCSCPYDYGGECKHVVAVLLAVHDRDTDTAGAADDGSDDCLGEAADVEAMVEQATDDDLRTFLLDVIEDERDIHDRFVAFVGEDTGKTVYDYKGEIDRLFDDAVSRRGMIEYDTRIDFSQYYDLAQTHRERGHVDAAVDIYRALAEAVRENMGRIDDSSGQYGYELERAIESYAETVEEQDLDHEQKEPYIESLVEEFCNADYAFVRDDYEDALRTLCTTTADLEHWLALLESHAGISIDQISNDRLGTSAPGDEEEPQSVAETGPDDRTTPERERTDDILYASDFTEGPLRTEEFTGGTIDVVHVAEGALERGYFVGDAFEELRIDDPTTVKEHTVDVEPSETGSTETRMAASLRTRDVVSSYIYVLEELGRDDALLALYEEVYLESSRLCKQYTQRLIDHGDKERAIEVVEDGIDTFRSTKSLRWLAADLYRESDRKKYRATLKRLFLDHTEWAAYDDLKDACDDQQWATMYQEFEWHFDENDQRRLISMYVHEKELQKAFFELKDSENLSWLRQYRDPVATVDPAEYFAGYREQLVPFADGETGRRHYREVAEHLEELQGLVSEGRFEEFVEFLKDKHSNRPAFLDELDKSGF